MDKCESEMPNAETEMAMVRQGWDHLRAQRPLAAWATWRRALRPDSGQSAAAQALATLAAAGDLPAVARAVHRLRKPEGLARRAAWDRRLTGGVSAAADLESMADAFGRLAADEPTDAAAWYNRALCLAWLGHNREAVGCLDRVVALEAAAASERAVAAGILAELLRQGAGAEALADDLRFACVLDGLPSDVSDHLDEFPEVRRVPTPQVPGLEQGPHAEVALFEWLDPPVCADSGAEAEIPAAVGDLPVMLASLTLTRSSGTLRLSSPRADTLQQVEELLAPRLGVDPRTIRREATPLPLPFLDADLWTVRVLPGVEPASADELLRDWVEHFYEDIWIHRTRQALEGLSPLAAAHRAHQGDPVLRAKLAAVVGFREQLGNRPSASRLYQGYPFDRLRRRLGLEPSDPAAIERADLTCASPWELDKVDPAALDDHRLVEAVASAAGLREDARTALLAAELLRSRPRVIAGLDLAAAVSAMVRREMADGDADAALRRIEQARPLADSRTAAMLDVWRAEILARTGRPDEAQGAYRALIRPDDPAAGAAMALDAAESFLDNGHVDQARSLLIIAHDLARYSGRRWIEHRVRVLLDRL
jgi:tetratricopeptide (TPR) repeat protein